MPSLDDVIASYERAINETDGGRQAAAAREALQDDLEFTGPMAGHVKGRDSWIGMIRQLREQAPVESPRLRRTTALDEHNGWVRFGWEFVGDDGKPFAEGWDVARVGEDGRLSEIVVFFGEPAPV